MPHRTILPLSLVTLIILLTGHISNAGDILVLDEEVSPDRLRSLDVPILLCQIRQDDPVQNVFSILRIDLQHPSYEIVTMVGTDPDGNGPADAVLTNPSELISRYQAIAAINANAFSRVKDKDRFRNWYMGMPVNILGMVTSNGIVHSTLEDPRRSKTTVAFWVDDNSLGLIQRPGPGTIPSQAIGDFYGYLVKEGNVETWKAGQRHPRTALGIDRSGRYLYLVVVDGRQKGYSMGTTMSELARFMKTLGCYKAINLDGGGSSIMMYQDQASGELRTINRPSSGEPRPVPVMLGVRVKHAQK